MFENTFSSPFTGTDLISLSTGKSATPVISNDLINAKTKGKEAMESFVNERLPANNDSCFFSLIKKLKLKTFDGLALIKKVKSQGREVIITADKELHGRMAIIASNRSVDPKEIFSYLLGPLGPIPWSLSGPLGTLRKTSKSVHMLELEKQCDKVIEIPSGNIAAVIDAVAIMQICNPCETFGSFANQLFKMMMSLSKGMTRVAFVFDKYIL